MKDNKEKTAEVLAQEIIEQMEKTNKIVAKINSPSKAIAVNKYMYYILNTDEVSALYTNIKSILKLDEDMNKVVTVDYKLGLYILKSGKFRLTFKGIDYTAKEVYDLKILFVLLFESFYMFKSEEELTDVFKLTSKLIQENRITIDLKNIESVLHNAEILMSKYN